jgi:hypothetical protein
LEGSFRCICPPGYEVRSENCIGKAHLHSLCSPQVVQYKTLWKYIESQPL